MLRKLLLTGIFILSASLSVFAQSGTIKGTVTEAGTGDVLPGANVYIKSLQQGEYTNQNGNYTINDIPNGTYTLQASFVGYKTFTQQVTVNSGTQTINISLKAGTSLNQVVVTGFGQTQQRRNLVSSISSVDADQIQTSTTQTIDQTLQGKTAGVQVTSTSGVLGAPVSVRVRGTTSINASSQPLYVLDGVPLVSNQLGASLGEPGAQAINPLVNLNPQNIKSIEVLKDASATAVYGSRGANGVVLITTKDGNAGGTQLNVGVSGGFTEPTERYDLLTGPQFARMYNYKVGTDFFGNVLPGPDSGDFPTPDYPDAVTRTGSIQNYTASASGGDEQTTFYVSGTYNNQKGYARPNQLQKYSALAKVNHQFNDKLNIGLSINPSRVLNNRISTSNQVSAPYTYTALIAPVIPRFLPNGDINNGRSGATPFNIFSVFPGTPYGNRIGIDRAATTTNIISNANAAYDLIPQLTLKTQFNLQFLQNEEEYKRADYTTDGYPVGSGFANNDQFLNYSWRNTLEYKNDWKNNSLDVLLGVTFQRQDETSINLSGNTFASNQLLNLNSASSITSGGGFGTSFAFQNNLARITYTFMDRYILTLNGSYNGSSRFGSDNRYGFFPAGAVGWIISDENFADNDWLSFLKLRASYGEVGNANGIGNFASRGLLGSGRDYNNLPGIALTQLASPGLSWESTTELDIGLDYGFLNDRFSGSVGYYRKDTNDLLLGVPVSATNGFTSITKNTGSIRNTGFEFDLNADIITGQDFTWSINANLSTLDNEVTDIPQKFTLGNNVVREGETLGAFFLREYAGVNPNNGDAIYFVNAENGKPSQGLIDNGTVFKLDKFGDRYVTADYNAAQRKIVGTPQPDFYGGFGTSINFKGLDASVQFQYTRGNKTFWQNGEFLATNLSSVFNQTASQLDYWTPDNTDASVPEPRTGGNGNSASTRYLLDASYLRLKNATIGYSIPRDFVNGYKIRIYAQGTNLLTVTDYRGLDPEVSGSSEANVTQGNTFFELPQPRTVLFGIQLGF